MASVAILGGYAKGIGTAQNMMYSGAVINNGARSGSSVLPPVDMTCYAINSTHYMCNVINNVQPIVSGEIPDVIGFPIAIMCGFLVFLICAMLYESRKVVFGEV